jgi:hypothetical protein
LEQNGEVAAEINPMFDPVACLEYKQTSDPSEHDESVTAYILRPPVISTSCLIAHAGPFVDVTDVDKTNPSLLVDTRDQYWMHDTPDTPDAHADDDNTAPAVYTVMSSWLIQTDFRLEVEVIFLLVVVTGRE